MRRWVVIAFIPAMIGVTLGSRFVRAERATPGPTIEICHISTPQSNAGQIITLKENSAAVNAHESLHGDCEDFDSTDNGTCTCSVNTDPRPTGDDDGEDDSDDDGPPTGDHNGDGHPDDGGGDGDDDETGD